MDVGKRIKELREKAELSNRQLSIKADIPQTIMNRLERGVREADVPIIEKVCMALGITLKEFFDVENDNDLKLNPEYIKLMNTAKSLPEEKLKILNDVAEGFKTTSYIIDGREYIVEQDLNSKDIPKDEVYKIKEVAEFLQKLNKK